MLFITPTHYSILPATKLLPIFNSGNAVFTKKYEFIAKHQPKKQL